MFIIVACTLCPSCFWLYIKTRQASNKMMIDLEQVWILI